MLKRSMPPAVKLAVAVCAPPTLDPDIIAAEIGEDLQAALAQVETRSLPTLTHCFPRSFTFYVAFPVRSIRRNRHGFEEVEL
jgi:hypothetical protein